MIDPRNRQVDVIHGAVILRSQLDLAGRQREAKMPYDFKLTAIVPASPQEIYDAWLDSFAHSEMTGSQAMLSDEIGAEIYAWDGYITGRNLELVPGERIVQSWRTTEFGDEHEDSIITLTLEGVDGGTLLTLVHSNVPVSYTHLDAADE